MRTRTNHLYVRYLTLTLALFGGAFEAGCGPRQKRETSRPADPAIPATMSMPSGPDNAYHNYYFVMPPSARTMFTQKVTDLKFGTDVNDVIQILGKPDDDAAGDAKTLRRRQHRSRCLSYTMAKFRKGFVTEQRDQYVDLYFDWQGRFEMVSSSYPGIASRQTADAMDERAIPGWWDKISHPGTVPSTLPATQSATTQAATMQPVGPTRQN